jgi:hypothetical protein
MLKQDVLDICVGRLDPEQLDEDLKHIHQRAYLSKLVTSVNLQMAADLRLYNKYVINLVC